MQETTCYNYDLKLIGWEWGEGEGLMIIENQKTTFVMLLLKLINLSIIIPGCSFINDPKVTVGKSYGVLRLFFHPPTNTHIHGSNW